MYSEEIISALYSRIGFSKILKTDVAFTVTEVNTTSNSGRSVQSFHKLCTIENIYSTISEISLDNDNFNIFLETIRKESVLEAINNIIDMHTLNKDEFDYSDTISKKIKIFDDAIGYTMAVKILELFITSTRSNATERSTALSFQALKLELEGTKNDNGHFIAKGIIAKKELAIKKAQKIIFPDPILIIGGNDW